MFIPEIQNILDSRNTELLTLFCLQAVDALWVQCLLHNCRKDYTATLNITQLQPKDHLCGNINHELGFSVKILKLD